MKRDYKQALIQDKFFAAEIDCNIATIDLHQSINIFDALEQLEHGLYILSSRGLFYCTVVHGIGSGQLAEAVHERLKKHPLVSGSRESESGGRCLVVF